MTISKPKRVEHDSPKKNWFIGMMLGGAKLTQAAQQIGLPKSMAHDLWKKYKDTGTTRNHPCSGCPIIVDDRIKRVVTRTAKKNRRKPFAEIGNTIEPNVSESKIHKVLAEANLHQRVARKVPFLTKVQIQKRMAWAKKYCGFSEEDWQKVIWSDECYIHLNDYQGRIYVTRSAEEEYQENCVIPKFKQSPIRVMVWGCVMVGKKGPLIVLEYPGGKTSGMNSKRYQEQVLDGQLLKFYQEINQERPGTMFQQDNAPSHRSKTTLHWFEASGIPLLDHPPSSPDLNPIEHVWHELKKQIRALNDQPNNLEQLITAVNNAWEGLPIEDINKHCLGMPARVEAVIAAKGHHTRF